MVEPSGVALTAVSTPTVSPPPAGLSTTTNLPNDSASFCAIRRADASVPPPGANGTMRRTGLAGYVAGCADTCTEAAAARTANPSLAKTNVDSSDAERVFSNRAFMGQSYISNLHEDPGKSMQLRMELGED